MTLPLPTACHSVTLPVNTSVYGILCPDIVEASCTILKYPHMYRERALVTLGSLFTNALMMAKRAIENSKIFYGIYV